jgi:hypothetical protein
VPSSPIYLLQCTATHVPQCRSVGLHCAVCTYAAAAGDYFRLSSLGRSLAACRRRALLLYQTKDSSYM